MKYLSCIFSTFYVVFIWLMILPFAILALPYLWIAHNLGVDSKGYKTVLDFFTSLKDIHNW